MKIDFESPIPLYFQIRQQLKDRIYDGTYGLGALIPTEMELCEMFGVSRYTVKQALDGLIQENMIQRKKGKGTFVTYNEDLPRINSVLGRVRKNQDFKLLACEKRPATAELRHVFHDEDLTEVVYFCRAQLVEDVLVSVESVFIPPRWAADIMDHPEENVRLHRCLENKNGILLGYKIDVSVASLNAEEQALAGISFAAPALATYTEGTYQNETVFVGKNVFIENRCYVNLEFEVSGSKLEFSNFAVDRGDTSEKYGFLQ